MKGIQKILGEKNGTLRIFPSFCMVLQASEMVLVVKDLPTKAGDVKDTGLIAGYGRSP